MDGAEWDVQIVFDLGLAKRTVYPAVDAIASWSPVLEDGRVSVEHADVAREVRRLIAADGSEGDRAARVRRFQSQPFFIAEPWSARPGAFVRLDVALRGYRAILEGAGDAPGERELLHTGALRTPA